MINQQHILLSTILFKIKFFEAGRVKKIFIRIRVLLSQCIDFFIYNCFIF